MSKQSKTTQDNVSRNRAIHGKTNKHNLRQDNTRQHKTTQPKDKTTQPKDKT